MQPHDGLSLDQFNEYNGLRYRAADGKQPEFLAAYYVTDMAHLETETYLTLRTTRSPRGAAAIGQVFLRLGHVEKSPLFMPVEKLTYGEAEGLVPCCSEVLLLPTSGIQMCASRLHGHILEVLTATRPEHRPDKHALLCQCGIQHRGCGCDTKYLHVCADNITITASQLPLSLQREVAARQTLAFEEMMVLHPSW
ncbi:hypothetical protein CFAM422_009682 [Trichoderma lentiforme]|uniref:Uncharacterized protein n=1 Tax=Trichoderma lentiforme TaxID=1567552 RepID=A0A9P4X991_9HYPO|nr:hypothetical protein CFAM422_009682 [Trichoderma lentiforme]